MVANKTEPGPKPEYLVVEDHLKCQTPEGEVSIDLRIPINKLELFMEMDSIDQKKLPLYIREHILWPEDREQIEGLRDGARAFAILMEFAKRMAERMGVSLGELSPSTASSESTEGPSDTTSDTTSD
jgi:hypothetical protein